MQFTHPAFFLLLLLAPLLAVAAVLTTRARARAWRRLVAPRLAPLLVRESPKWRRAAAFGAGLLGFALLVVALAGPTAGYRIAPETIRGRNLLIAIDVSRSMLATDENPDRLTTARAAALELLDHFPDDRIGIIAFSGTAWLQAPLTIDHDALRETLQQLDYRGEQEEWLPRGGTDLAQAVTLAVETFRSTGLRNNALVILSDGETHEGGVDAAAEKAHGAGLTIFSLACGTDNGSFIPDPANPRDGKLHDSKGNLVLTRLNPEPLRLLARRTGGFYASASGSGFTRSLEQAVARLDRFELEGRNRRVAIPRFQWFLLPAIFFFAVSLLIDTSWQLLIRTTAAAALLACLAPPARAAPLRPTPAARHFDKGDYGKALELFEAEVSRASGERKSRLQLGEAAAAYRLGRFARAQRAYSGALLSRKPPVQEQAHFGLGNTHFYAGARLLEPGENQQTTPSGAAVETATRLWRDAIGHFEAALALNPGNHQARQNRDHVRKRLEELLRRRQQQEQNRQQEPQPQPDQANQDQPGEPREPPADPPPPGEDPQPDQPGDDQPPEPDENEEPANPEPHPGETPEEFARRILESSDDLQSRPIPMRIRPARRPLKNW